MISEWLIKLINNKRKTFSLLAPLLVSAGIVLIGGSEYAKEKWKGLDLILNITSSIGAALFAGAAVTVLYNYYFKEIDKEEIKESFRTVLEEKNIDGNEIENMFKNTLDDIVRNVLHKDNKIHRIIYFVPTLLQNEFYQEMLHQIIILAGNTEPRIDIIAKVPANLDERNSKYHQNDEGYNQALEFIKCDENTLLLIVPCNPEYYTKLFKLTNLRNIITLDMEVPASVRKTFEENPSFLASIRTDNGEACRRIVKGLLDYCGHKIHNMNIIICEGNFHGRGNIFKETIENIIGKNKSGSKEFIVKYFPDASVKELDFGNAIVLAEEHVQNAIYKITEDKERLPYPTFIFCANDNMGIGARNAMIKLRMRNILENENKELTAAIDNTKIICYDYSSTVKNFIDNNDNFIYFSAGQEYRIFAAMVMDIAQHVKGGMRNDSRKAEKHLTVPPNFHRQ